MKKLLAIFFLGFGTVFLLLSLVLMFSREKSSVAGALGLVAVLYSVSYVLWPIQKKKLILDRILGSIFSIAGFLAAAGNLRHLEWNFRGGLAIALSLVLLLIGVVMFLKKGAESPFDRSP
jgi:uncharacterized membrane protein YfcA